MAFTSPTRRLTGTAAAPYISSSRRMMLAMSGCRTVPRRSTEGMSASRYACSWSSWVSRVTLSAAVLNLSVFSALKNTPGIISSRR